MKLLIDTNWATFVEDLSQEKQLEFFWAIFDYGNRDCSLKCWSKIAPLLEKGKIKYYNRLNNLKQFNTERESESVSESESESVSESESESVTESEPERESEREYKYKIENIQDSNKGVVGGKEKGDDSFVAELEREVLAKEKKTRFVKPTLEQVKEYCAERKNSVDAERFVSYYDSNGWKVGKNPMKDWKAAVRTWERSGFNTPQKAKSISSPDYVGEGSFLRRAEDDPFCADL